MMDQKLLIGALVGLIGLGAAAVAYNFWYAGSPKEDDQDEAKPLMGKTKYNMEENKELTEEDLMDTKPKRF